MKISHFAYLRENIFTTLANTFPVTSASDEFPEFPQVSPVTKRWDRWDCFSANRVETVARRIIQWEKKLSQIAVHENAAISRQSEKNKADLNIISTWIDLTQLITMLRNLREHLILIRRWERQPTFYLTIAAVGMAEALDSGDPAAPRARAKGLADFLDQAGRNLQKVPTLFNRLGIEMAADVRRFFQKLVPTVPALIPSVTALDRFRVVFSRQRTIKNFHLPAGQFDRLIRNHLNTGMTVKRVEASLDSEIKTTRKMLTWLLDRYYPGMSLGKAYRNIPLPRLGDDGLLGLYNSQIDDSVDYLIDKKILSTTQVDGCPVTVKPVPDYLSATRSASSYSIPPGHPPAGGTFYVINADDPDEATQSYQREYRILTAHETYPGHHLLDSGRWRLTNPVRQVIEQPLFYEGWACFAEELMFRLGYLRGPSDLFMLIRRRFWRALRGKVDLGLQTGTMTLELAARTLNQAGLPLHQAKKVVRKYALNPGYQICYTVGYLKFRQLFNMYGRGQIPRFVQAVTSQGEIHFDDLATVLKKVLA